MTDLILAMAHHVAVFSLAALLAMELAILRPGIEGRRLHQLGLVDLAFGTTAAVVLVVGFARVFFGENDSGFYLYNPVFWTKIGLFVIVGLLSVAPTLAIFRWRREANTDPAFTPPLGSVARIRGYLYIEAVVFLLIPLAAAAMARGYGL
jgi:putative membrane protein